MKELYGLIGDSTKIISRAEQLLANNQTQLALQILDVLNQADPENVEAIKLRMNLVKNLGQNDTCLMSRNAYYCSVKQDKKYLRKIRRDLKNK